MALGGFGWLIGWYPRLVISSDGLRVHNPLSRAVIPWGRLRDASGAGVALRLYADDWSIGVFSIQRVHLAAQGRDTADAMASWLLAERDAYTRATAPRVTLDPLGGEAVKRWGWGHRVMISLGVLAEVGVAFLLVLRYGG